jgi:Calcineurin-like phosphoesterase
MARTMHVAQVARKRTMVVGDVHGCRDELEMLLDKIGFGSGDHLVFVGDLIARGPDSRGVLAIARSTGADIVRGNHEARVLAGRAGTVRLGGMHAAVSASLSREDWVLLETSPLWLELPEHGALIVHAGMVPGVPLLEQTPETLLHIRTVHHPDGSQSLWGATYRDEPHVVFGHHALAKLQLHPYCTGLDTGCVYGGALTALVLDRGEPVPRDAELRRRRLVQVSARRAYYATADT